MSRGQPAYPPSWHEFELEDIELSPGHHYTVGGRYSTHGDLAVDTVDKWNAKKDYWVELTPRSAQAVAKRHKKRIAEEADEELWGDWTAGRGTSGHRAVRAGQKFVIVDVSVPGGRWVDNIIYDSAAEADRVAAELRTPWWKARRVQVIDAVWYGPAEARLQATGMRASRGQRCCGDKREKELLAEIKTLKKSKVKRR